MDIAPSIDPFSAPPAAPAASKSAELRALRRENRLARETIESRRLAVVSRRLEVKESLDWAQPWLDIVRQAGPFNQVAVGPASRSHRKKGQNFPVYRTEQQLNILRAGSRALLAANPFAQGLLTGLRGYVIGPGYTYRATPKKSKGSQLAPPDLVEAVQRIVDETLVLNEWHGGELPPVEEESFDRSFEDGEFLHRSFFRPDGTTLIRFPEPEQLTRPPMEERGFDWGFGVRTPDRDVQTATAYWLVYGDSPDDGDLCEPHEVTHFRRKARRNMKRGIPEFAFGTLDLLDLAQELALNLASGAAEQAAIASVMQTDTGTEAEIQAVNLAAADGTLDDAFAGRTELYRRARRRDNQTIPGTQRYVEGPAATNTSGHIATLDTTLRGAGRPFQAPEWLTSGNANGMNFATSLTAESPFTIWVKNNQKGYKSAFARVIWGAVEHYIRTRDLWAAGRTWTWSEVKAAIDLVVEAPDPVSRDPLADATRFSTEMPLGVDSPQAYCQRHGRDYAQIQSDLDEHVIRSGGPGGDLDDPTDPPPPAM